MTAEEIIKELESVKTECGKHLDEGFAWICKPINEAIEVLKREPCDDCISRQAVLDVWHTSYSDNREENEEIQYKKIAFELPSVTPETAKGEWKYTDEVHEIARCSKCNFLIDASGGIDPEEYISIYKYCPNCGADMREVKE